MRVDSTALLAILGMAIVTFATRITGFVALRRVTLPPRLEAGLHAMPGAVLMALVAPSLAASGAPELGAALVIVLVVARTRNVLLAVVAGVLAVVVLRALLA